MNTTARPAKRRFPWSYSDCVSRTTDFKTGRRYLSSKIANNTYIELCEQSYIIRLHATNLVTLFSDGSYQLQDGGWRSAVTFDRLRTYSPLPFYRKGLDWYVLAEGKNPVKFISGMMVNKLGQIIG